MDEAKIKLGLFITLQGAWSIHMDLERNFEDGGRDESGLLFKI